MGSEELLLSSEAIRQSAAAFLNPWDGEERFKLRVPHDLDVWVCQITHAACLDLQLTEFCDVRFQVMPQQKAQIGEVFLIARRACARWRP